MAYIISDNIMGRFIMIDGTVNSFDEMWEAFCLSRTETEEYWYEREDGIRTTLSTEKWMSETMEDEEIEALKMTMGKTIDVGCGSGKYLKFIEQNGKDRELWGIDISSAFISIAKEKTSQVTFIQNNMLSFFEESEESFDTIMFMRNSICELKSINEIEKMIKLCIRRLSVAGKIVLDINDCSFGQSEPDLFFWNFEEHIANVRVRLCSKKEKSHFKEICYLSEDAVNNIVKRNALCVWKCIRNGRRKIFLLTRQ